MKQRTFAASLVLIMLPLIVLPILDADGLSVYGCIRIPSAGICAEVYTTKRGQDCGCCGALWNGGQAFVQADMSAVHLYDMVDLRSRDGEHLVLECVEIVDCIRVGRCLVSWQGIVQPGGDVLLCTDANRWPFVRVLRLARL
ncbi:MAG: hypothetical protein IJ418_01845 [Clostridia bacterium]|nr:hypothetical protein [Clostridia bacterium]